MSLKPNQRRPEFDEITTGWGADGLDDLLARCQLLSEFWTASGGLTDAERKVANAMRARLMTLGNVEFTFNAGLPQ